MPKKLIWDLTPIIFAANYFPVSDKETSVISKKNKHLLSYLSTFKKSQALHLTRKSLVYQSLKRFELLLT